MKLQTNLKIESSQKELFIRAAGQAQEDLTEFLVNSAMLRIQRRLLAIKPKLAMEVMDEVFLRPYAPDQVSKKDARHIEQLLQEDRRGKWGFKPLGRIKVKAPQRKK